MTAPTPKPTYYEQIQTFLQFAGPMGDLARDLKADTTVDRTWDSEQMMIHISKSNPCAGAWEAAKKFYAFMEDCEWLDGDDEEETEEEEAARLEEESRVEAALLARLKECRTERFIPGVEVVDAAEEEDEE